MTHLDLPEQSRHLPHGGAAWYLSGTISDIRRFGERVVIFGRDAYDRGVRIVLDPAQAEKAALALLAAARHQGTRQDGGEQ